MTTKKPSEKSSFYAARSRHSWALAFSAFAMFAFAGVVPFSAFYAAAAIGTFGGLCAVGFLISTLESRRIVPPFLRRKVCELGADGLLVGEDFYPWRDIAYAERDEHDGGEHSNGVRRVEIGLRDAEPVYVELLNPERFVREVLVRSEPDDSEAAKNRDKGYRLAPLRQKETLVRIVIDGAVPVEERIDALQRLDVDEREQLKETLVDTRIFGDD